MTKPTLLQSIFGRPSQSYAFPSQKDYYSSKSDFLRAAATASPSRDEASSSHPYASGTLRSRLPPVTVIRALEPVVEEPPLIVAPPNVIEAPPPVCTLPSSSHPHAPVQHPYQYITTVGSAHTPQDADDLEDGSSAELDTDSDNASEQSEDDREEDDVFYTPQSSPNASPATSMYVDASVSISALLPPPDVVLGHASDRSSSSSYDSAASSSASTAPTSDETHAAMKPTPSSSAPPSSAPPSSAPPSSAPVPLVSPPSAPPPSAPPPIVDDAPLRYNAMPASSQPLRRASTRSATSPASSGSSLRSSHTSKHSSFTPSLSPLNPNYKKSYTYTDEDWAKEVRWLVPTTTASSSSISSKSRSKDKGKGRQRQPAAPIQYVDLPPVAPGAGLPAHRRPKRKPGTRAKELMTALMEEDEDATGLAGDDTSTVHPHVGTSRNVLEPDPPVSLLASSLSRTRLRTASDPAPIAGSARSEKLARQTHTETVSRSSVHGHVRASSASGLARPPRQPVAPTSASTSAVHLPSFSPVAAGLTTLTLPRATYKPGDPWRTLGGGKIDLALDGKATTTMVSVEVVQGAARSMGALGVFRRSSSVRYSNSSSKTRPGTPAFEGGSGAKGKGRHRSLAGSIALTSHLPPPSYVSSSQVLIQVVAIALEGLDAQIVAEKAEAGEAGFVPGRGVVGRAVEVGWDVREEVIRKGEWVVGLADVKKCGALAEFILLDRHRVHRVPSPSFIVPSLFTPSSSASSTPTSSRSQSPTFHAPVNPIEISVESLALLPLIGIPAYRAVRTYMASNELHSGRALVLRGQDGVGGLATLMLLSLGISVTVQIDTTTAGLAQAETDSPFMLSRDECVHGIWKTRRNARLEELYAKLMAWGVDALFVGNAQAVCAHAEASAEPFDFVLDTVGGKAVWEAAQRVLARPAAGRGDAQFTTVVGETSGGRAVPSAQDHWKAGVRSLRRAISTSTSASSSPALSSAGSSPDLVQDGKDKGKSKGSKSGKKRAKPKPRAVGYSWVSCVADVDFEGGDVREALGALASMLEGGVLRPDAVMDGEEYGRGRVLGLERTMDAFDGERLEGGGTVVIRVGGG